MTKKLPSEENMKLQHNIVNLLHGVKTAAESHFAQVEEGRFSELEERLRHAEEFLERAGGQARVALEVTKRLARLLKGEAPLRIRTYQASLKGTWQTVQTLLLKEFSPSGIEILERIPEQFPLVNLPPEELEEILYAISRNAFQALSSLPLSFPKRFILRASLGFSTREERCALVSLSDTGPGIPPQDLQRLFHPFFTTKPLPEGNGLGLYLARELVQKNQGKITVASFEGHGTTFTLELPLA